jgi:uncharacterized protein
MPAQEKQIFQGQKYIALETYRKTGEAVRTPVWFAHESSPAGTTIYVYTLENAGKTKRIRRTSRVKLALSDSRGNPLGDWVEGEAAVGDTEVYQHGNGLMNKKYGLMKKMFELFSRSSQKHVIIQIHLMNN